MLLFVGTKWNISPSIVAGWTTLWFDPTETADGLMVLYRFVLPGDTASIQLSTQQTGWVGCLFELSGVGPGNIISVQKGADYAGGSTPVGASSGFPDDGTLMVGMALAEGAAAQPAVTLTGATPGQTAWATGSANGGNRFVTSFTAGPLPRGGTTIAAGFSPSATTIIGTVAISPVR
ncbi:hypothetical protein [Gluconacetobacter azotocaptans]|uniref:hypothetical protein n=1 Tax=Gluconacetobacter azotocaptans TaxID=142834 RepID=UPI001F042F62|nr:hypothetical protein [Gluconacetobacter azotocaptans]